MKAVSASKVHFPKFPKVEPLLTVCCVSFQIFSDSFIYKYMYTVFPYKWDQIIHTVLTLASVLNNIRILFIHKILTKGLGTRLTGISALTNLVALEAVSAPICFTLFSNCTALWFV